MDGKIQGKWDKLNHKIFSIAVEDWPAGIYQIEAQANNQLLRSTLSVVR